LPIRYFIQYEGGMTTILVLDDDQVILDLLRTVLTDAGYEAIFATGPDAVPANASADLVITDLVPLQAYQRERALRWIESLRTRFAGAPVLVLTAHRDAAAENDMLGANAIMTKPLTSRRCSQRSTSSLASASHAEDAVAHVLDRRVPRRGEPEREHRARIQRIDDAVVP
jgi:DNA-binding response OmpR family regulator